MAAYAVTARLDRTTPHRAERPAAVPTDASAVERFESAQAVELVGRPLGSSVAERMARVREAWAQMTFYLFDAESWR
ncbi:MAG TPA: hypothetical protein VM408_03005 [Methylomirabilota bacterium]|nr:hypothetical protein [Methylomirabilota bacterium]